MKWGSMDTNLILEMIRNKHYQFEVNESNLIIKGQDDNFDQIKNYFKTFKSETKMGIKCYKLRDGGISIERYHIDPIVSKYLNILDEVDDIFKCQSQNKKIFKDNQYFLDNFLNLKLLFDNAIHLLRKFPQGNIFGLGQSPAWILETAKLLDNKPSRIKNIAFSGKWQDNKLKIEPYFILKSSGLKIYKDYLESISLNPKSIIANPIILIEHTHSGGGLKSFLEVLFSWAQEIGINKKQLMENIHVHIIVGSTKKMNSNSETISIDVQAAHIPRTDPSELCIKSGQMTDSNFCVEMSNSPNYDRLVPHYAYHEWSSFPDQNKLDHEAIRFILNRVKEFQMDCCQREKHIFNLTQFKKRKISDEWCVIDNQK